MTKIRELDTPTLPLTGGELFEGSQDNVSVKISGEELKDYMIDLFKKSPIIRENFDSSYLSLLIKEHLELKHNHNHILWALVNLSLWYKKFFQ